MGAKETIKQGLGLAAGVFTGIAVIAPMILDRDFKQGVLTGFIAAALILVIYSILALRQSDNPSELNPQNSQEVSHAGRKVEDVSGQPED